MVDIGMMKNSPCYIDLGTTQRSIKICGTSPSVGDVPLIVKDFLMDVKQQTHVKMTLVYF